MAPKKAAVLIGCNYPGSKMELKGCVNDVQRMRRSLVDHFGFSDSDIAVLIDTDDSYIQPTGVNIRRTINRLLRSAKPGDELFVHYSGHGARLPVEPEEDDNTGYHECIVPSDMNLILDEDFRDFADKLPSGCRMTIVADSCNSGGLLENAKEQIGESTLKKNITHSDFVDVPAKVQLHHLAGEEADIQYAGRALPLASILEELKQRIGTERINEQSIRSTLVEVFGEAASPRMLVNSFKQHWRELAINGGRIKEEKVKKAGEAKNKKGSLPVAFSGQNRGKAILISACQSDQNAADAKPVLHPEGAFGALSNAVQSILDERRRSGDGKITVSNREVVMMAREILAKQGFTQRPGLYCTDDVADDPFINVFC